MTQTSVPMSPRMEAANRAARQFSIKTDIPVAVADSTKPEIDCCIYVTGYALTVYTDGTMQTDRVIPGRGLIPDSERRRCSDDFEYFVWRWLHTHTGNP